MPAEAIAEATPASAPAIVTSSAKAPALASAPKVEINASRIGEGAEPPPPPKPGSARARMAEDLRKRAGQEPGTERVPEKVKEAADEKEKPAVKPEDVEAPEEEKQTVEDGKGADEKVAPADPKKGKVNPWKLVDELKAKRAELEAKLLDTEKRAIPEDKWKQTNETLTAREARLKELEEEIRYVNYSKSEEFKKTYQEPYDKAWASAMEELGEIKIEVGDSGEKRTLQPADLLRLVNLPVDEAQAAAEEMVGAGLAGEMMAYRKDIKKLWNAQADALERVRKEGAARETQQKEQQQRQFGEVSSQIKQIYTDANEEARAHPKYGKFFAPVEGDENVNQRLAKGFELVDRAFNENPMNAKTPEERASIVKRHAAVRNRAAAFGRLVYENEQLLARAEAAEKKFKDIQGSEPETKGTEKPVGGASTVKISAMESTLNELRKRAKQR